MTKVQSATIIRTAAGLILLAAGIGLNIILVGGALAEHGDYALLQFVEVEVPMIFNCWVLTAVGWWLMYPRQWMGFARAAIWFAIAMTGWVVSLIMDCWDPPPLYILGLATFFFFIAVVILEGLWRLTRWGNRQDSSRIVHRTKADAQKRVFKFVKGSIFCGVFSILFLQGGIVLSLLGISLGIFALYQIRRGQAKSDSVLAITGIICSSAGLVISVGGAIWFLV